MVPIGPSVTTDQSPANGAACAGAIGARAAPAVVWAGAVPPSATGERATSSVPAAKTSSRTDADLNRRVMRILLEVNGSEPSAGSTLKSPGAGRERRLAEGIYTLIRRAHELRRR